MNCREFVSYVIDLVHDQLPAPTDALVRQHAEQCAKCAARLKQEQVLFADMRLVAADIAQQEAPAWIEANLLTALRTQAEQKRVVAVPITRWWSWQLMAGVTAGALLLVVLFARASWRKAEPPPQQYAAKQLPAPLLPEIRSDQAVIIPAVSKTVRTVTRRSPLRRTIRAASPPPHEELPFYSLVTEGEMAPLESGRIVRIEVPPATLVNLGVPLTETTLTQPVQADLLLGQDGLARAIRFLPYPQTTRTQ